MKYLNIQFILSVLSIFIVASSTLYYVYLINYFIILLSLIIAIVLSIFLNRENNGLDLKISFLKIGIWPILFIINIILSFLILFLARTSDAMISPWQSVSFVFFILYFLSTLYLIFYLLKKEINKNLAILLLTLLFLLSFLVNTIVFKLGYGFDPFIHQTALEYIKNFNYILPKTPYYIGYYSLVLLINKITFLTIPLINKVIVPVLSALILPILFYKYSKQNLLTVLFALTLNFSIFTVSTPQNLAFLFLLITIFLNHKKESRNLALIMSLATLAIHPIAGIPALSFSLLNRFKIKKIILAVNILIFPFIFYFFNQTIFSLNNIKLHTFSCFYLNQENLLLNSIYFWKNNAWVLLLLILIIFSKKLFKDKFVKLSLLTSLSFFIASFISQAFVFSDLISYEQFDYSARLKTVALIFILPAILKSFSYLSYKIQEKKVNLQIILTIIVSSILITNLYISYPRLDNYHNSRAFSISQADIEAVYFIESKMDDKYIVLSNQQLAVVALKELGFKRYLEIDSEEIYFYSIPTGGKLYQFFLETVYQDHSSEPIKKAMNLGQVNHAWLAIHSYWWASDKIIEELKLQANSYYQINEEIHLFYFQLPSLN